MNQSTQGVTLFALFLNDVLRLYKGIDEESYQELFDMTKGYDLSDPFLKVPISLYNYMCKYVEENLGEANLKKIGENIGESVYEALINQSLVKAHPEPKDILNGLIFAAANMVQDPEGRGWEMLSSEPRKIIMRRTQTFNSKLQLGLLKGLVRKTKVLLPEVNYVKMIANGDEYDEYEITWK